MISFTFLPCSNFLCWIYLPFPLTNYYFIYHVLCIKTCTKYGGGSIMGKKFFKGNWSFDWSIEGDRLKNALFLAPHRWIFSGYVRCGSHLLVYLKQRENAEMKQRVWNLINKITLVQRNVNDFEEFSWILSVHAAVHLTATIYDVDDANKINKERLQSTKRNWNVFIKLRY